MIVTKTATMTKLPMSFGFSGAGFLTSYHLGVAECLIKHGFYEQYFKQDKNDDNNNKKRRIVTGVSGGALAATALAAHIHPHDCMQALMHVTNKTRQNSLDTLQPGFSLVDQVELVLQELLKEIDQDEFLSRINTNQSLRIGLMDRRQLLSFVLTMSNQNNNNNNNNNKKYSKACMYVYIDKYRSIQDVIAACISSCYIPGVTGPLQGANSLSNNQAIYRSNIQLQELENLGYMTRPCPITVNNNINGSGGSNSTNNNDNYNNANNKNVIINTILIHSQSFSKFLKMTIQQEQNNDKTTTTTNDYNHYKNTSLFKVGSDKNREWYWDGGLVNTFPIVDSNTCIVTPFAGYFPQHHSFICPKSSTLQAGTLINQKQQQQHRRRRIPISSHVELDLSMQNAETVRRCGFSSSNEILQSKYEQGYNDAIRFLYNRNDAPSLPTSSSSSTITTMLH